MSKFQAGVQSSPNTQFQPGQVPFNKGMKRGKGWAPGRMAEGQFKPGCLVGSALAKYKPIGTVRITKDGYRQIKVNDGLPSDKRWKLEHILNWETHNGPVPAGHCVCFKNGNRQDSAIENLFLMSRIERMKLNTYLRYPKELADVIRLQGAVNRQINKRIRNEKQAD